MEQKHKLLEVCTGSLRSVEAAVKGGAERVELCSALGVDGLTPSYGLMRAVRQRFPELTLHVLIRPREGDFVYSATEIDVMLTDIYAAVSVGADGIVVGCLDENGDIDAVTLRRMVTAASGKPVTFHRAFDVCRHPLEALQVLKEAGCRRLLTSGQQPSAEAGIPLLKELVRQAGDGLIVMPGAGVNADNAARILCETDAQEIHASASDIVADYRETSTQKVSDLLRVLADL